MQLKLITKENFDLYYSFLEKDFIFEERRTKKDEFKELQNEFFKPYFIYEGEKLIGYFTFWEFEDFVFGEHFAILEELRNSGLGTEFVKNLLIKITKPFVFEIEKPIDITSKRRKQFYKRLNLKFNKFKYYQPSYHGDGREIEMILVSYPDKLTQKQYENYVRIIKKEVYKICE